MWAVKSGSSDWPTYTSDASGANGAAGSIGAAGANSISKLSGRSPAAAIFVTSRLSLSTNFFEA